MAVTTNEVDVVVVGAGASGLRCAELLQRSGHTVTVLESRDRVGGRLLSVPVEHGHSDARVDLGATWFWPGERRVNALVGEGELHAFGQHLDGDMMFQNRAVQRIRGNQLDAPSGRLSRGTQAIAERIASQLEDGTVLLEQAVTNVATAEDRLAVMTGHVTFRARHVVLAVPPALALTSIAFDSALPDDLVAVAQATPIWMGSTTKIVAVYSEPFWRAAGLAGAAFSHDGPMREIHDMSGPDGSPAALFGFCSIAAGQPPPTRTEALTQLTELFGSQAQSALEVHIADWRTEPFTTTAELLGLDDYRTYGHDVYQQPVLDGRLHFSSTETSREAPGHIEGALAAAERTATTIIAGTDSQ